MMIQLSCLTPRYREFFFGDPLRTINPFRYCFTMVDGGGGLSFIITLPSRHGETVRDVPAGGFTHRQADTRTYDVSIIYTGQSNS
jgi:hypothetical protein